MEVLTDIEIQAWLSNGDGDGDGNGHGNGDGNGHGNGDGYGDGDGDGNGHGNGDGNGDGYGDGYGDGHGYGYGDGHGSGYGNGDGYGDGIKELDGHKLYPVDGIPTAVTSIHGNVAQGFTLTHNVERHPCFIVKENDVFAHGDTLRGAFADLQEKLYDNSTEEERIKAFTDKFPSYDTPYPNADLFAYHHVLTGSCRMGREQFCQNKDISLNGKTTVRQFVEWTKDSYGGGIISKLPSFYKGNKK